MIPDIASADLHQVEINTLDDWAPLARSIAAWLQPGDVVALNGTLGAGKTTLVQAIGKALGITESITSPTFTLLQDYDSPRFSLLHVDLYRLGPEKAHEVADELVSAVSERQSVVIVEWAEYGEFLDELVTLGINITYANHQKCRMIQIQLFR